MLTLLAKECFTIILPLMRLPVFLQIICFLFCQMNHGSVRGLGKLRVLALGGLTKKGRLALTLGKYL